MARVNENLPTLKFDRPKNYSEKLVGGAKRNGRVAAILFCYSKALSE
jgi:hypothetical protein